MTTQQDEQSPLLPTIREEAPKVGIVKDAKNELTKDGTNNDDKTTIINNVTTDNNENNNENVVESDSHDSYARFGNRSTQAMLFGLMLLTNVLGPLSTEAQVPALQDIADDLNTTSQWVQLTITIYMLSFGASQLFFGTLSDMYGRRNTLLAGLIIYVLTNLGCALAPNVILLNIFRAIQAMGSGAGMVIVYAIARDVFDQDDRTRVLGFLGGLRPIVIASSPVFGGAVTAYFGWRYIFWIIGGLSLGLLVLVFFFLPETRDATTVHITTVAEYKETIKLLIKNRIFIGLVLISGAVYAGVFIMFNEFSFVMELRFGISEFDTGLLCGLIVFGLMVGSLISIAFVRCMNPISVVACGIVQLFVCAGLLVLPIILYASSAPYYDGLTEYWTIIPLFLYVSADGLMLPHLISTALEPFRRQAGTASALAGFWRFFSAAVIALVVSASSDDHVTLLHAGPACMGVVSAILYVFTLYGADASEFTASRDAQQNTQTEQNTTTISGGVQVIDEENDNQNQINNSINNNNISQTNDKTPLIQRLNNQSKHVTIEA